MARRWGWLLRGSRAAATSRPSAPTTNTTVTASGNFWAWASTRSAAEPWGSRKGQGSPASRRQASKAKVPPLALGRPALRINQGRPEARDLSRETTPRRHPNLLRPRQRIRPTSPKGLRLSWSQIPDVTLDAITAVGPASLTEILQTPFALVIACVGLMNPGETRYCAENRKRDCPPNGREKRD